CPGRLLATGASQSSGCWEMYFYRRCKDSNYDIIVRWDGGLAGGLWLLGGWANMAGGCRNLRWQGRLDAGGRHQERKLRVGSYSLLLGQQMLKDLTLPCCLPRSKQRRHPGLRRGPASDIPHQIDGAV